MSMWKKIFCRRKTKPQFSVVIELLRGGNWSFRQDFADDNAHGSDVMAALMLHVQAVSQQTGQDGKEVLADMQEIADKNYMGFYPVFDGVPADEKE